MQCRVSIATGIICVTRADLTQPSLSQLVVRTLQQWSCMCIFEEVTAMFAIHVSIFRFGCFRAHLWLNFDLKAATEPAGLFQRWACNSTNCLEDPLGHLLHDNVTIDDCFYITSSYHYLIIVTLCSFLLESVSFCIIYRKRHGVEREGFFLHFTCMGTLQSEQQCSLI